MSTKPETKKNAPVWFPGNCPIADANGRRCMKSVAGGTCAVHGAVAREVEEYKRTGVLPVAS